MLDELLDTYNIEFDAIPVSNSNLNSDSYNSVLSSAQIFIQKMEQIHAMLKTDLPVDALFITPGDFVYHASNLERVSKMYVSVNRD